MTLRYGLMMLGAGMALVAADACLIDVETYPERSVVASTGAGGGSGGGTSWTTGKLSDRCMTSDDCEEGLECTFEVPGSSVTVAGGACSKACDTNGDCPIVGMCEEFEGNRVCVLRCDYGSTDPEKCWGRDDTACVSGVGTNDAAEVCVPRCVRHSQCPSGQFCHPGVGVCFANEAMGDPVGTPCNGADGEGANCRGVCMSGICTELCIVGQDTCPSASYEIACVPDRDEGVVGDAATCLRECCRSGPCPGTGTLSCNRVFDGEAYCSGTENGPDLPCSN